MARVGEIFAIVFALGCFGLFSPVRAQYDSMTEEKVYEETVNPYSLMAIPAEIRRAPAGFLTALEDTSFTLAVNTAAGQTRFEKWSRKYPQAAEWMATYPGAAHWVKENLAATRWATANQKSARWRTRHPRAQVWASRNPKSAQWLQNHPKARKYERGRIDTRTQSGRRHPQARRATPENAHMRVDLRAMIEAAERERNAKEASKTQSNRTKRRVQGAYKGQGKGR